MNVFLVGSPLQLLSALEAREHFALDAADCTLIVVNRGSSENLAQIERLAARTDWRAVHVLALRDGPSYPLSWLRCFRRIDALARAARGSERVFIGYYGCTFMRHFANACAPGEVFLLDDGASTLAVPAQRRRRVTRTLLGRGGALRGLIKRSVLRVRDEHPPRLHYFTVFSVEADSGETVTRHDFPALRRRVADLRATEEFYVLGTCLSDLGILSESAYLESLRAAQRILAGRGYDRLVYVPHREEKAAKLARLRRELDIDIRRFELPIELALVEEGLQPAGIGAFCSSALANLGPIFGERIPILAMPVDLRLLEESARPAMAEYLQHLRDHFPQVEHVPPLSAGFPLTT